MLGYQEIRIYCFLHVPDYLYFDITFVFYLYRECNVNKMSIKFISEFVDNVNVGIWLSHE